MEEAALEPLAPDRFAQVLTARSYARFADALARGAAALRGHTMWHINTTLKGGGVAEMLGAMLPYVRGAGIDCRWIVVDGDDDFMTITKRLHNVLHGFPGDGGELGAAEADRYAATLADNQTALLPLIRPGDLVFVHDPQTAGLIPALRELGAHVVWHCHIGTEEPNDTVRRAWRFLGDQVAPAHRYIFSRADYLWDDLDADRMRVIRPTIDPFSAKNQHLDDSTVDAILKRTGVVTGAPAGSAAFTRQDGTPATVSRPLSIVDGSGPVPDGVPIALQSARWDWLKDPTGVIDLFADHLADARPDLHLVVAGPSVDGVTDDPEGQEVLAACARRLRGLPEAVRRRVHLMCSPMEDDEETEAVVNALQRRADVVVQKSLAEGFGMVVAEAMWKRRPVVSARVGGIQDQIEDGRSGVLIDDPRDNAAFARAVAQLLDDPDRAAAIGSRAHERVLDHFLTPRQLTETMDLVCELTGEYASRGEPGSVSV